MNEDIKIIFSKNLNRLMELKRETATEVSEKTGIAYSTVNDWKNGKKMARGGNLQKLSDHFGVNISDLTSENSIHQLTINKPAFKELKGKVAAGLPLEMFDVPELVSVPYEVRERYPNSYLLELKGDSMNKLFMDGSYVLIDPCDNLENGEIGVVRVNHTEATLKRFYKLGDAIMLQPESTNPEHQNQTYDCSEGECESISILGKLVWAMTPIGMKF